MITIGKHIKQRLKENTSLKTEAQIQDFVISPEGQKTIKELIETFLGKDTLESILSLDDPNAEIEVDFNIEIINDKKDDQTSQKVPSKN